MNAWRVFLFLYASATAGMVPCWFTPSPWDNIIVQLVGYAIAFVTWGLCLKWEDEQEAEP